MWHGELLQTLEKALAEENVLPRLKRLFIQGETIPIDHAEIWSAVEHQYRRRAIKISLVDETWAKQLIKRLMTSCPS